MNYSSDLEIDIMIDIVDKCEEIIKESISKLKFTKKFISNNKIINSKNLSKPNKLNFLITVCSEIRVSLYDSDVDSVVEAARMIDFLQGGMWMCGLISVSKLKELNSKSAMEISSLYDNKKDKKPKIDIKNLN